MPVDLKGSPFSVAENRQAFLKAGIYGFGGSGKTYTACMIAKGIYERLKDKKPVAFMDTETGSDYAVPWFKEWGIPLVNTKSRSFVTLMQGIAWAEKNASVLIVDSVTHFWKDMQDSYKKAKTMNLLRRKGISEKDIEDGFAKGRFQAAPRLTFSDWGPLKDEWGRFTDQYLNSNLHVIICGRAGWEYDFFEDEEGNKQIEKTGSKMKAETELSYEPSLLIEMRRESKEVDDRRVDARFWDHTAYILKDRTTLLDGKRFINPTFDAFMPVWNRLNIGGEHLGVDVTGDSSQLFARNSDASIGETKRKIEIILEEIQGDMTSAYPGRSAEDTKTKADLMQDAFGTRSWTAVSGLDLPVLRSGREKLKTLIAAKLAAPAPKKGEK